MKQALQPTSIPAISMTTFVDFVQAGGTARLSAIRKAKDLYQEEYQPPFDFYKQLRERIVEMHKRGEPSSVLDQFLARLTNARKDQRYQDCVTAYKKWLGRKRVEWTGTVSDTWTSGELSVRVNPELGLAVNDRRYAIKLYFKQQPAAKAKLDVMLHLMQTGLQLKAGTIPAILDVPRGRLVEPTSVKTGLDALLAGEAAAFSTIWRAV